MLDKRNYSFRVKESCNYLVVQRQTSHRKWDRIEQWKITGSMEACKDDIREIVSVEPTEIEMDSPDKDYPVGVRPWNSGVLVNDVAQWMVCTFSTRPMVGSKIVCVYSMHSELLHVLRVQGWLAGDGKLAYDIGGVYFNEAISRTLAVGIALFTRVHLF